MSGSCGVISVEYCELLDRGVKKKVLLNADDVSSEKYKITKWLAVDCFCSRRRHCKINIGETASCILV